MPERRSLAWHVARWAIVTAIVLTAAFVTHWCTARILE